VSKRTELPLGWEKPEDEERIAIVEEAFRYSHAVRVYGSRWSRDQRWPPWTRPSFVYGEIRLPDPSITYDIGVDLGASEPPWTGIVADFYKQALNALRSLTAEDGFIYAVNDFYDAYRFWPHRADPQARWVFGCPGSIEWNPIADEFVVPVDFSWVFHAKNWETGDRITLSGQALLDAFELHRPELLSTVVVEEQRPPTSYEELRASKREMDAMMKVALKEADEYAKRHSRPSR
jgi:hypothetical protein